MHAPRSAIEMLDCMSRIGFLTFLPFLMLEKGASAGTIGLALALVFAGGAAGKLACGILAERMGLLATVIATEMLTGVLILLVALTPLIPALVLLPVLGVALNGTSSVLYGTVGEFVRADRQSRAFGLFYSLGSGANTLGPAVFGLIADRAGLLTVALILAVLAFLTLPVTLWLGRIMAGSISDRGAR